MQARLAEFGENVDYVGLTEEILGIRNVPPALARRLVAQALVLEDRRDEWRRVGERIVAAAPATPGVYVLRGAGGEVMYVGKAINLRRRLRAHFSSGRWRALKATMARVADADWVQVGSDLEALLREAEWIGSLGPVANVQRDRALSRRIPSRLVRDVVVVLPSVAIERVMLVAAQIAGPVLMLEASRDGRDLTGVADRVAVFFERTNLRLPRPPTQSGRAEPETQPLAPIVFSWLAGRGRAATRIEAGELASSEDLTTRLRAALRSPELFSERLVLRNQSLR